MQSPTYNAQEKWGRIAAAGGYVLWGLLPLFWKLLDTIPAIELLAHRVVWSLVFLILILAVMSQWDVLAQVSNNPRKYLPFVASAVILAINWFTYIYAMNTDRVVSASLGYFINPLFSVVLGVVFLRERLRFWQWSAVGLALIGVLYLTMQFGQIPWIALVLAFTFGVYGLIRKTAPLGSLHGLSLEMTLLFIPALCFLIVLNVRQVGHFAHAGFSTNFLLMLTGVVTALPLLLFAFGAKRITLASIGILQYIAPSLQFLLGVFLYREPFTTGKLIGFLFIWTALILYTLEGVLFRRHKSKI